MTTTPDYLYGKLDVTAINAVVNDVSPFVRNRQASFPVLVYEIPTETFDRHSTGYIRSVADAEVSILARSSEEVESIADTVITTLQTEQCIRVDSLSREYDPSFDGSSAGIYLITINLIITRGA